MVRRLWRRNKIKIKTKTKYFFFSKRMAKATYGSPLTVSRALLGVSPNPRVIIQPNVPYIPNIETKYFKKPANPDDYNPEFSNTENNILYKVVGVDEEHGIADVRRVDFRTNSEGAFSSRILVKVDPKKKYLVTKDAKNFYEKHVGKTRRSPKQRSRKHTRRNRRM